MGKRPRIGCLDSRQIYVALMCCLRALRGGTRYRVFMKLPVSSEITKRVQRLEIPFSRYGIDRYGMRRDSLVEIMSMTTWLYRHYFSVHVQGLENIPTRGRAILVCNHSGGWALDALMIMTAVFLGKDPPRIAQGMADRFMAKIPLLGQLTSHIGSFCGLPENAQSLLKDERLLLVFPEGAAGTAKLYHRRNSLVDFGTGFLRLALETQTPIIPMAFVGAGEAIPTLFNIYSLGKKFGVPYIPVTPWIFALPRRTTFQIQFGKPLIFHGSGHEEDAVVNLWVSKVRSQIAMLLASGVNERSDIIRESRL